MRRNGIRNIRRNLLEIEYFKLHIWPTDGFHNLIQRTFMRKQTIIILLLTLVMIGWKDNQEKKRIVFFGDSITQAGVQPKGYITVLGDLLKQKNQAEKYELIGAGIGGNKVYDLYLRMDDDVLAKNPNIVVIWVGVNDVWHKRSYGTGTDA